MDFDKDSIVNANIYQDTLLVYAYRYGTIYQMNGKDDEVVIWNEPDEFIYTGSKENEKTQDIFGYKLIREGKCKIIVQDPNGVETVVVDKNEEYNKLHPSLPKWIDCVSYIGMGVCAILFVVFSAEIVRRWWRNR